MGTVVLTLLTVGKGMAGVKLLPPPHTPASACRSTKVRLAQRWQMAL